VRRAYDLPTPAPTAPADDFADLAADVLAACIALRDVFTDDELLVIGWKRDHEGHAELTGYDLTEQDGTLQPNRDKTLLRRAVPHQRIHDAVSAARAGRDDTAVAVDFARRAAGPVDAIVSALEAFP
jgi:hypothetical protein